MLKAGVYVDAENVMRCGGWGMRYDALKEFAEAQGAAVVRANAYMAADLDREQKDPEYRRRKTEYRSNLRQYGFKLVLKPVKRFRDIDGNLVTKANADLDLAVDALLQARNLDYVILVTGDGDFVKLVVALQNYGCRVDVIAFHNASKELRETADNFCSGFLLPGLIPTEAARKRGFMHVVNEEKFYGWLTAQVSLRLSDVEQDIFCHGSEVEKGILSNDDFAALKTRESVLEFDVVTDEQGRKSAKNVILLR